MPLNTDLNVSPYFDDFNANNQYYRVLFRPAVGVQARELNQVQSILQNQIESFGNWAFKSGDIVSGCTIFDDPQLPFIRLQDFQNATYANGASNYDAGGVIKSFDVANFANTLVVSATSNLSATVIVTKQGSTTSYPNTNVVYVNYINTGIGNSVNANTGDRVFAPNEILTFYNYPLTGNSAKDIVAVVNTFSNAVGQNTTGIAHGIHVDAGIIFINGSFVQVLSPTYGIVNNYGTYAGNNVIGFSLEENIITENQDSTLLDNALGYSNENAPGANRLQLKPSLVSLDPVSAAANTNFNVIATYNYGQLVSKTNVTSNVYSVLGDVLAKRTYEESGNYVVNPFVVDTVTTVQGNSIVASLNANNVLGRVSPGVGYAQGYRVELLKTAYLNMRRGIDTQSAIAQQITFNYGNYFPLVEVAGSFDFANAQSVYLFDAPQKAVTRRLWGSVTPTAANTSTGVGNAIGTAQLKSFAYNSGTPGSNTAQYNLYIFNLKMNPGYNINQVKAVYYNGTVKGVGDVTPSGIQQSSTKDQLYSFGVTALKNLKDSTGINNYTQYTYRTKQSQTMTTNTVTCTILSSAGGGYDYLPYGGFTGQLTDLDAANFTLIATANVDSVNLGGTVNIATNSLIVINATATATSFNTVFRVGDQIKVGSDVRTITAISSANNLTVDSFWPSTLTNQSYKKAYVAGKIIPITTTYGGPTSYVNATSNTSFTIFTNEIPSSSLSVDVVFDILRTQADPAKKVINKNRFVKIDTRANPNGPWCLGVSDIHNVSAIYGSTTTTFTDATGIIATNLTKNFTFDTGQKDTHYDLGYLYPVTGYTTASYPYLLVQLDYFTYTNPGVGFFTIESYPIDDANTANTTAITTANIPLYIDEAGKKRPLRDYIDFRTTANTALNANNTGSCNTANPTSVNSAVSYATMMAPANTITSNLVFSIPPLGLNTPSPGKNFQSDYTFYLPRKDLILITPDNNIKIKEGLSSIFPQTPLYPENAMTVAVVNMPPYPSLSSDQLDSFLSINQLSKNLVRDTSLAISTNNVTIRRYTMKDIGKLDSRITNLEYYVSLSLLEKKTTDMTITDANGLDRFKNGIFVDPMNDFTQSDVSNQEYSIAIDSKKGMARPRIIREIINVEFDSASSTNWQKTGRLISLPYTEVPFIIQPYSTKYRSSAHVSLAWNGTCILIPPYDNHSDINNTGSINITVDTSTPWKDFAKSPFGSIWGDWKTVASTSNDTVITDQIATVDVGNLGLINIHGGGNVGGLNQREAETAALNIIHQRYGPNVTIGNLNIIYGPAPQ